MPYALDEKGGRVLRALENPKYDWRTMEGISNETGIDHAEVARILHGISMMYPDQIVQSSVPDNKGRPLFTTRRHYYRSRTLAERLLSTFSDRIK